MEILAAFLIAYLVASPDRVSLALTRGITGSIRGGVTGKTPKSSKSSPRSGRAIVAGWREGVTAARERREAGRDLWSRGTRGAGRVYGGTTSLVVGLRGAVEARRARKAAGEIEEGMPDSPDAVPARRNWAGAGLLKRSQSAPTSEGTVERTQPAEQASAMPEGTPEPVAAAPEAAEPAPAASTSTPETNTTTASSTPSEIGVIRMPDTNIEISNLDALDKFLKGLQNVFADLTEASARVKQSGKHLASQWEGAEWGTRNLDRAISDICEEIAGFKVPAAESFKAGRSAITEARSVGEAAQTVKARGNTEAFTGNN